MSDQTLALIVIVACATLSVWAVALASRAVDLGILPLHKRHRVQWCQLHDRQVLLAGTSLLLVLVLVEVLA
jgi:hypothetical protein